MKFGISICAAALAISGAAQAACVQTGKDVVCTGAISTGFGDGSGATDKLRITVTPGTVITTTGKAFEVDDKVRFTNHGVVRSTGDEAFEGDNKITLINHGTIEALDDAVQVNDHAVIVNHGTIRNIAGPGDVPQDALDLDSGHVSNYGVISSAYDAAIDFDDKEKAGAIIVNHGRISGTIGVETDPGNGSGQHVVNYGRITGTSGVALNLGAGDDSYTSFGGALSGGIHFGTGDDLLKIGANGLSSFIDNLAIYDGGAGTNRILVDSSLAGSGVSLSGEILRINGTVVAGKFRNFAAVNVQAVPLPGGALLLGTALVALLRRRVRA